MPKYKIDPELISLLEKIIFSGFDTTYSSTGKGSREEKCQVIIRFPDTKKDQWRLFRLIHHLLENRRVKMEKSIAGNMCIYFKYARNKTLLDTIRDMEERVEQFNMEEKSEFNKRSTRNRAK